MSAMKAMVALKNFFMASKNAPKTPQKTANNLQFCFFDFSYGGCRFLSSLLCEGFSWKKRNNK